MNIYAYQDVEIDDMVMKPNTGTTTPKDNPQKSCLEVPRPVMLPMTNTKSGFMDNPHYRDILKGLRPQIFVKSNENRNEKGVIEYRQMPNQPPQVTHMSQIHINRHQFQVQNGQSQSNFNRNSHNQNILQSQAISWVTPDHNFKSFDVRSNPFHFFEPIQQDIQFE